MGLVCRRRFINPQSLSLFLFLLCFAILFIYQLFYIIDPVDFELPYNSTSKYPFIALIIDDRATNEVFRAINNVLEHIPQDWKIQFITPIENWSFYNRSALNPLISAGRVFLTNLTFPRLDFTGSEYINLLLTSAELWQQVQGEKILYFQIDSVLCSNSPYNLTEFLNYDFIGAPWTNGKCCNGGLSLRSRTKMLKMFESGRARYRLHETNEDVWLNRHLARFSGSIAPFSIAKRFSVEGVYHPRPFAVHKPNLENLGLENIKRLCNDCPEVKSITSYC